MSKYRELLLISFGVVIITLLFSVMTFIVQANSYGTFLEIFNRWDTSHYLNIAEYGYQSNGDNMKLIVFFPLYPLLIKIFSLVFHSYIFSAWFIANVFFMLAAIFLYKLVLLDFNEEIAWRSFVFLLVFPTAYFFHVGYTESLFLFLCLASFYYARKEKWLLSGLMGFGVMLTRIVGIVLIIALAFEYVQSKDFDYKKIKADILWLLMIPLGMAVYLATNYKVLGSPLAFFYYQKTYWDKEFAFFKEGLMENLRGFTFRVPWQAVMVSFMELAAVIFCLAMIIYGLRKLRAAYSVFALLSLFLVLSNIYWLSTPRYLLAIFPLYMLLAIWGKNRVINYCLIFSFLLLQSFFLSNFIMGRWAF